MTTVAAGFLVVAVAPVDAHGRRVDTPQDCLLLHPGTLPHQHDDEEWYCAPIV